MIEANAQSFRRSGGQHAGCLHPSGFAIINREYQLHVATEFSQHLDRFVQGEWQFIARNGVFIFDARYKIQMTILQIQRHAVLIAVLIAALRHQDTIALGHHGGADGKGPTLDRRSAPSIHGVAVV